MMYTVGVVAHQARKDQALTLAKQVEADYISIDDGTLGCAGNHHHVQHHLSGLPTTWTVILEDDAIPVQNFREQLEQALPMSPTPIVSFYLGRRYPPNWQNRIVTAITEATNTQASWIVAPNLLHAVAYAIRTDLIPALLEHPAGRPPDEHITKWAKRYGHTTAYTWPSLANHADGPTLTKHRSPRKPGRTAWATAPHTVWNSASVPM